MRGKIHRSGHIRELSHEFDRQFQTGIGITRVQGIYHQVFPLNEHRVEALEVLKPRGNELQIVLQRTAGSRRLRVSGSDFNMRINSDLAHALAQNVVSMCGCLLWEAQRLIGRQNYPKIFSKY